MIKFEVETIVSHIARGLFKLKLNSWMKKLLSFSIISFVSIGFAYCSAPVGAPSVFEVSQVIKPTIFDIPDKRNVGNVLIYFGQGEVRVLQSGLGISNCQKLVQKMPAQADSVVTPISGLGVVLLAGEKGTAVINGLVSGLETEQYKNWGKNEMCDVLSSLLTYSNFLDEASVLVNEGGRGIEKISNKTKWAFILSALIARVEQGDSEAIQLSKDIVSSMVRGSGIDRIVLKSFQQRSSLLAVNKEDMRDGIRWGRFALHTEAQLAVLNRLFGEGFLRCYSLYNPCASCQNLKWVNEEARIGSGKFYYCLRDNQHGGNGRDTIGSTFFQWGQDDVSF